MRSKPHPVCNVDVQGTRAPLTIFTIQIWSHPVIGLDLGTLNLRAAISESGRTTVPGRHAYVLAQGTPPPRVWVEEATGRKPDDPAIISERGNWPFEIADGLAAVSIPAKPSSTTNQRSC